MIIAIVFSLLYIFLLVFYTTGWFRLSKCPDQLEIYNRLISIVVAARNEEENIGHTIRELIEQHYPNFLYEIIIVDDGSTDSTAETARAEVEKHPDKPAVKIISLEDAESDVAGKKKAIEKGVAESRGNYVIVTDADCHRGMSWLRTISAHIAQFLPCFVSGPVAFYKEKNLFEKMQSIEFSSLIGIGASCIGNKLPTLCNGANMAFERSVFYRVEGYSGLNEVSSGDDEFLLHKIAKKHPGKVSFLKNPNGMVFTRANARLKDFIRQRRRWVSKSRKYKNLAEQGMQIIVWLFHVSIIFFLFRFLLSGSLIPLIILFSTKLIMELIFITPVLSFFSKSRYIYLYPLSAILYVFYVSLIAFSALGGKYYWKGRRVR